MYNAAAKDGNYFLLPLPGAEAQLVKLLYPGNPPHPISPCSSLYKNDNDRRLLGIVTRVLARAVAGPPGVPKARIDATRTAFVETIKDPAYLAGMTRRKMAIENSMNGAEVTKYIDDIASTTKRSVDRYIAAVRN